MNFDTYPPSIIFAYELNIKDNDKEVTSSRWQTKKFPFSLGNIDSTKYMNLYKKTRNQLKAPVPQVSTKLAASQLVEKSWCLFVIVSWCSVMPLGIQKNKIEPQHYIIHKNQLKMNERFTHKS